MQRNSTLDHYIESGTFLGYIDNQFNVERFAVIKTPKLDQLVGFFSPELNVGKNPGDVVYSNDDPTEVGKPYDYKKYFPDSPIQDLEPNSNVNFFLQAWLLGPSEIDQKKIFYTNKRTEYHSNISAEDTSYEPEDLHKHDITHYIDVTGSGQIVGETDKEFIVDVGMYLFIEKTDKFKLGDWVKAQFYRVDFQVPQPQNDTD